MLGLYLSGQPIFNLKLNLLAASISELDILLLPSPNQAILFPPIFPFVSSKVKILDYWQGKKPSGVAGALLYNAAKIRGNSRTQAEICEVADISEVTLRGLLKVLKLALKQVGEATEN